MKIVFFDTETTGTDPAKDSLCQLAWMTDGVMRGGLYKPPMPIPAESSAVHHISNKMVADRPAFRDSDDYAEAKTLFESEDTIVVAHNAKFDIAILAKEGIAPKRHICTLRVARAMDPDGKLSNYKLQYLRYALDLNIDETAAAHSADGDVLVLEQLFNRLLGKLCETMSEEAALKEMTDISSLPSLVRSFSFGKHNGRTVAEVAKESPDYLAWLLAEKEKNPADEEDWIFTLKTHLGKL